MGFGWMLAVFLRALCAVKDIGALQLVNSAFVWLTGRREPTLVLSEVEISVTLRIAESWITSIKKTGQIET